jgi:hypothetical protein
VIASPVIASDYQTVPRGTRRKACLALLGTARKGQGPARRGDHQDLSPSHEQSMVPCYAWNLAKHEKR